MLEHELLAKEGGLIVRPEGPLTAEDFAALAQQADAHIEAHGGLKGLMICAVKFPGWENLDGAISHFRFVRDHHRKIARVAFVSDADMLALLPKLASHFVSAEVKHFRGDAEADALAWIAG